MRIIGLLLLLITGITSCISRRDISGTYRSNFADMGFFTTKLNLKRDSSFDYSFRGDLLANSATGIYKVIGRNLMLTYNLTPVDTAITNSYKTMGIAVAAPLKNETSYPRLFYLRNNKIYVSWQDGKIVRRAQAYSKHKKYLLFGSHHYKKKYYLKKIE